MFRSCIPTGFPLAIVLAAMSSPHCGMAEESTLQQPTERSATVLVIADVTSETIGGDANRNRDQFVTALNMGFGIDSDLLTIKPIQPNGETTIVQQIQSALGPVDEFAANKTIVIYVNASSRILEDEDKQTFDVELSFSTHEKPTRRARIVECIQPYKPDLLVVLTDGNDSKSGSDPGTAISAIRGEPITPLARQLFLKSSGLVLLHGSSARQPAQSLTQNAERIGFRGTLFSDSMCRELFAQEELAHSWSLFTRHVDKRMQSEIASKSLKSQRPMLVIDGKRIPLEEQKPEDRQRRKDAVNPSDKSG